MSADQRDHMNPVGRSAADAAAGRARRSAAYRAARAEYAAIRELRQRDPLAARIRELRYELGLTEQPNDGSKS